MRSILYNYTPNELQMLLNESNGYSDLLRKVGLNPKGRNPETLKKIISEYNLDETQLNINRSNLYKKCALETNKKNTYDLQDILNGKHPFYQSSKLLKRLVEEEYKEYKCENCGIYEWMNKPITLQLHHKDGNHNNNILSNLQILCPNCHSQTDSYGGKTSNKFNKESLLDKPGRNMKDNTSHLLSMPPISRNELKYRIRKYPFVQIAEEYNVSGNAIRKWCDKYGLPRHSRVIKDISDEDWESI